MHWLRWFRPRDFIVPLSAFGQRDLERRNMKGREPMYQESCEKCINMQSIQCVDMPKSTASNTSSNFRGTGQAMSLGKGSLLLLLKPHRVANDLQMPITATFVAV